MIIADELFNLTHDLEYWNHPILFRDHTADIEPNIPKTDRQRVGKTGKSCRLGLLG